MRMRRLLTSLCPLWALTLTAALSCGCTTALTTRPDDFVRRAWRIAPPSLAIGSPEFARAMDQRTASRALPGNRVMLLNNGGEAYPAMLAAIAAAQESIDFSVYTYANDATGRRFREAFVAAARRGVRVRLCYDRFGSPGVTGRFFAPLTAVGGQARVFNPFANWTLLRGNNRNHQKILVVDGEVAFMGSVNLADKHNGDGKKGWRDLALEVRGPAVADVGKVFDRAWGEAGGGFIGRSLPVLGTYWAKKALEMPLNLLLMTRKGKTSPPCGKRCAPPPAAGDAKKQVWQNEPVRVIANFPENFSSNLLNMLELAIAGAERRVCLCSPYFILPPRLERALLCARARGVEVLLLTQGESDVDFMPLASQGCLRRMLANGVKIFAWPHSILHAKYATVDGRWATVGSTNLDSRSLILNCEANFALEGETPAALEAAFLRDINEATPYNHYRPLTKKVPWLLRTLRHQF